MTDAKNHPCPLNSPSHFLGIHIFSSRQLRATSQPKQGKLFYTHCWLHWRNSISCTTKNKMSSSFIWFFQIMYSSSILCSFLFGFVEIHCSPSVGREKQESWASVLWASRHLLVEHNSVWEIRQNQDEICLPRYILFILHLLSLPWWAQKDQVLLITQPFPSQWYTSTHSLARQRRSTVCKNNCTI